VNFTTRRIALETHQRLVAIAKRRSGGPTFDTKISEGKPDSCGLALGTALSFKVLFYDHGHENFLSGGCLRKWLISSRLLGHSVVYLHTDFGQVHLANEVGSAALFKD